MTNTEWLKPGIYGIVIGGVLVSAVGFAWGGWVTGGNATKMANTMSRENVVAALVPVCLEKARVDPDREAKLTTLRAASSYQRRDPLMATGWATMPGSDAPNRDLAQACVEALKLDAKS